MISTEGNVHPFKPLPRPRCFPRHTTYTDRVSNATVKSEYLEPLTPSNKSRFLVKIKGSGEMALFTEGGGGRWETERSKFNESHAPASTNIYRSESEDLLSTNLKMVVGKPGP